MKTSGTFVPGLKGVIASETKISLLDTDREKIIIRGHDLIDLSKDKTYTDVIHLLLEGNLPTDSERKNTEEKLKSHYQIPENIMNILHMLPKNMDPMDAQRTAISVLAGYDNDIENHSVAVNKERAYRLLSQLPTITINSYRILQNKETITPDSTLSYSANFLYMITGEQPTEHQTAIFDKALLLYSEHEMPNSTFAARVIASTNTDMYGALTGAVSSLKGNLHGGANEAVMHLLNETGSVSGFKDKLKEKLANHEKIMGFGHRVYMDRMDPRALVMKNILKELCDLQGDDTLLEMCEAGEAIMKKEKGLYPNLDYYAAPVFWLLDIPISLYTPIFFSARAVGFCAHIIEQQDDNYLYRPRVHYIGEDLE